MCISDAFLTRLVSFFTDMPGPLRKRAYVVRMANISKNALHGWINLYKPAGMTSAQAVGAVKRILRPQKIGHAGTLDPLAEGVLPLALGEATKTVPYLVDARKRYVFTICWGEFRTTDDAEGEATETSDVRPAREQIESILPRFTGGIRQTPPAFSAIKVDGKRAYDLARAGEAVALRAREVVIETLEFLPSSAGEEASFRVTCSKGTYIRSLARDMARTLGTAGYVSYLKREAVGDFCAERAISLDFLEKMRHNSGVSVLPDPEGWLFPLTKALDDIPALAVDKSTADALRHGRFIPDRYAVEGAELVAYEGSDLNKPIGIVERRGSELKPKRLFNLNRKE